MFTASYLPEENEAGVGASRDGSAALHNARALRPLDLSDTYNEWPSAGREVSPDPVICPSLTSVATSLPGGTTITRRWPGAGARFPARQSRANVLLPRSRAGGRIDP